MEKSLVKLAVLSGMLLGLPLIGVLVSGRPVAAYMAFPPETRFIRHAPFSWAVFTAYSVFIVSVVLFLLWPVFTNRRLGMSASFQGRSFPWWGWVSITVCMVFWGAAWSRFPFLAQLQPHTFTPLWVSFIFVLNALTFHRTGRCMLTHRTGLFVGLFPLSAVFWWFFEYLNRFVQNWFYTGVKFEPLEYFLFATFSFSTVLPAVAGMRELLCSYGWVKKCYAEWLHINFPYPKPLAWSVLTLSGIGLTLIGVLSDIFFPLLWVSPLLIVVSLNTIQGEPHIFSSITKGGWTRIISYSFAAILCGVFWEMWNFYSLAKWQYSVPFVNRFHVFEMPVLGYAGYLPFGLECAVVVGVFEKK